ncbi:MAG: trypsin-like peptidase domain-containing protein [Treponema sp.]|nr:trypsin-like peptidase domain-containing protein [Treponema sp.]
MKLYSRGQMVRNMLIGSAVAAVFAGILILRISRAGNQKEAGNAVTDFNVSFDESAVPDAEASFLQQDSAIAIPVSSSTPYTQEELQTINVYEQCNEAVVNINTQIVAYDWFLEPYVQEGGSGSGSIIDKRGYILTNVHVIQGASAIYVSLFDGTQYEAEVVGQDFDSDLAVIKFTPPSGIDLKTIGFGDSASLKVGQRVIAIGNPFGLERTMTTGIVSGLGRPIQNSSNRIIRNMIQTDAAINPGNSGGPLLDAGGKMIGINTMIKSSSGSSSGVGFAVPSETAVRVVADLLKYGKVQRGKIDAVFVQNSQRIARYAGLDIATGVLVSQVTKGGKADSAGLKGGTEAVYYGSRRDIIYIGGDVIVQIDNIAVSSLADYYSALESKRAGDVVSVVVRRNKKNVTLSVTLVEN